MRAERLLGEQPAAALRDVREQGFLAPEARAELDVEANGHALFAPFLLTRVERSQQHQPQRRRCRSAQEQVEAKLCCIAPACSNPRSTAMR
jgi:hypothetical protein